MTVVLTLAAHYSDLGSLKKSPHALITPRLIKSESLEVRSSLLYEELLCIF